MGSIIEIDPNFKHLAVLKTSNLYVKVDNCCSFLLFIIILEVIFVDVRGPVTDFFVEAVNSSIVKQPDFFVTVGAYSQFNQLEYCYKSIH